MRRNIHDRHDWQPEGQIDDFPTENFTIWSLAICRLEFINIIALKNVQVTFREFRNADLQLQNRQLPDELFHNFGASKSVARRS